MIFLQGLEKVQVTIQTQSELLLESTVKKRKMYKMNRASAVFDSLYRLSTATKYAVWTSYLSGFKSWFDG